MSEMDSLTRTSKAKKENKNPSSRIRNTKFSQSINSPVGRILHLQRSIGNQTVQRMVRSGALQAKLGIGQPGDKYEQEADRVADAVMRMPEPGVQRQVEPEEEEEMLQAKPLAEEIAPLVQRQIEPEEEEEEMLQAKSREDATSEVTNDLESQINAIRGGGRLLAESERAHFEPRFGYDFSQVRLHTDTQAVESAQALNARAFTIGSDVVFGDGQYSSETREGQRLMAHELTHVVQQGATSKLQVKLSGAIQRQEEEPAPTQAAASALTQFTGSNFIGDTVIADMEFVDSLEAINEHAGNNNVQVYVTHSFRRAGQTVQGAIVTPATRSNHLAGHAIDMNVQSGGRLYNSEALNNFESLPEDVQNFINAIRNDPGLRWGGDFSTTDPVHIDDNLNSDDAEWQERYNATQASPNP